MDAYRVLLRLRRVFENAMRGRKDADSYHDDRDGDDDALALEPLDAREHLDHLAVVVHARVLTLLLLAVEQLVRGGCHTARLRRR